MVHKILRRVLEVRPRSTFGAKTFFRHPLFAGDVFAPPLRIRKQPSARLSEEFVEAMRAWASEGMGLSLELCASQAHILNMATMTRSAPKVRRFASTKPATKVVKGDRLVARITPEDKLLITRAATLVGQSVGSFVLAQARKAALTELETRERIQLNAAQSRSFVEALLGPARKPPAAVTGAYADYRATVMEK